jgi:hypothetical protein
MMGIDLRISLAKREGLILRSMALKRLHVVFVAVLVALLGVVASGQTTHYYVSMRFEDPNGVIRDFRTPEGTATAQIQLRDGDSFRDFYLRLAVRDATAGVVLVSLLDGRDADSKVLDEFELTTGGGVTRTQTTPSFGLAALGIEERGNP